MPPKVVLAKPPLVSDRNRVVHLQSRPLDGIFRAKERLHAWEIGRRGSFLPPHDPTVPDQKSTGHLQTIPSEHAHPTSSEKGHRASIEDPGTNKLEKPALSQSEGPVKIAPWIGNPPHPRVFDILVFLSLLEHVNENQACALLFGPPVHVAQVFQ
jgi:hypothetical protein